MNPYEKTQQISLISKDEMLNLLCKIENDFSKRICSLDAEDTQTLYQLLLDLQTFLEPFPNSPLHVWLEDLINAYNASDTAQIQAVQKKYDLTVKKCSGMIKTL